VQGETAVPHVSVVIPTCERPALVVRTLAAVLDDVATSEVIVVVDGDDAETDAALLPYVQADPRVRITRAGALGADRRGEQRVRDHGATLARSEVVLALDDDIVAAPGLVSAHARWHATDQDLVVLGYMPVATALPGHRWSAATRLYAENYERACVGFEADPASILLGLWGGNFSVRREHWLRALELERLPVDFMHTDREFGLRLRQLGLRARFDRGLRSTHHDERDVRRLADAARGSAVADVRFQRSYADVVAPSARASNRFARWLVDALVTVTRPERVWRPALELLARLAELAQARNLIAAEHALTRLIWRVAYERELRRVR
jgi:glycosyltransferase involved in cell wall biosynthesis